MNYLATRVWELSDSDSYLMNGCQGAPISNTHPLISYTLSSLLSSKCPEGDIPIILALNLSILLLLTTKF
jgi:hypothetical protein